MGVGMAERGKRWVCVWMAETGGRDGCRDG